MFVNEILINENIFIFIIINLIMRGIIIDIIISKEIFLISEFITPQVIVLYKLDNYK